MRKFVRIFLITGLTSLNFGTLLYVHSTFISKFFLPAAVTGLFLLGYAFNIFLFAFAPYLLERIGKERLLFICLLIVFLSSWWLAYATQGFAVATAFVLYQGVTYLVYWCLDVFLEEKSLDAVTGEIRGVYYTFVNVGIALGPLVVTLLSGVEDLRLVYRVGTLILLVPLILSWRGLITKRRPLELSREPISLPFAAFWRMRDIKAIAFSRLILEIFYAIMVIYTPLYLHGVLGFSWSELGIIFTVALLPFIFLEWPAGELADRFIGEKELLSAGFFITGTTLLLMPFLDGSFVAWLIALFVSRVGASLIEIMTETYFFKKINAENTGLLSIFRLMRPAGLIIGALLGFVVSQTLSFPAVFLTLGVVVLLGLYESLHLKDTK